MSSEEQAAAYLVEARLTLRSARAIMAEAGRSEDLWAQVVKNGYDAVEQAVSAALASRGVGIPRKHPAKISTFLEEFDPGEEVETVLLHWLRRRSDSQYVDIRGNEVSIPHEQFDGTDAERILEDAEMVLELADRIVDGQ